MKNHLLPPKIFIILILDLIKYYLFHAGNR